MKNFSILLGLALALGLLFGGPAFASPPGLLELALAPMAGQFLGTDDQQPMRRTRRDLPAFENVVATGITACEIPRLQKTLFGAALYMSGTTFNESHITDVRLRLGGSRTLWVATGADLRKINKYRKFYDGNRQFLYMDFSQANSKSFGGQFVGGLDMSTFPAGKLKIEVTILSATAPALVAKGHWGPSGSGSVMQKLLQINFSTSGTGRKVLPINPDTLKGARLRRLYAIYAGTSWEQGTATSAAWTGNTGTGAMGTVTSTVGAQAGVHKIMIIEPGANVGTFTHQTPDGILNSKAGVVASAYASGGLSFTLADSVDFIAGDGFDLTVGENTNGNIARLEVIKNGEAVWDMYCNEARNMQKQNGFVPQSLMYVVDFEVDGWPDGSLKTADAKELEIAATFTAADSAKIYAELLDDPNNNLSS
jgi:hypothetical protein